MKGVFTVNVTTREKQSSTNELHDWIDSEVPQMIDDEIENKFDENLFDEETLKQIEAKVTAMLKEYFK